jgi:hypothetical protein
MYVITSFDRIKRHASHNELNATHTQYEERVARTSRLPVGLRRTLVMKMTEINDCVGRRRFELDSSRKCSRTCVHVVMQHVDERHIQNGRRLILNIRHDIIFIVLERELVVVVVDVRSNGRLP